MAIANVNIADFLKEGSGITFTVTDEGRIITIASSGGGGLSSGTTSGTDTYTVTIGSVASYTAGDAYVIKFANANTGASTLNINSIGAVALKKSVSTAIASGDLAAGSEHLIVYDGTNFQVLTISGGSGTVNIGSKYRIPYYSANPSGTVLDAAAAITAARALKSDANGVPTHFDTATEPSLTELSYVKGVTSAIQTQFTAKANLASPTFTGTPAAPTAANGTNTTQIATTAFVQQEIATAIELDEYAFVVGSVNYTQRF